MSDNKSTNDKAVEDLVLKLFDSMSSTRTVKDKKFEKFILDRIQQKESK